MSNKQFSHRELEFPFHFGFHTNVFVLQTQTVPYLFNERKVKIKLGGRRGEEDW